MRETGGGEQIILEKVPDLNRFVFRASNSVMQALDEQRAEYVVKFTSATKTLAELKPEVEQLQKDFKALKPAETILGFSSLKRFCP